MGRSVKMGKKNNPARHKKKSRVNWQATSSYRPLQGAPLLAVGIKQFAAIGTVAEVSDEKRPAESRPQTRFRGG